jgi:hypothetical protein
MDRRSAVGRTATAADGVQLVEASDFAELGNVRAGGGLAYVDEDQHVDRGTSRASAVESFGAGTERPKIERS